MEEGARSQGMQPPLEARKSRNQVLLKRASREEFFPVDTSVLVQQDPLQTLISRTVTQSIYVALAPKFVVICYSHKTKVVHMVSD